MPTEGEILRDQGIDQVLENTYEEYKRDFEEVFDGLVRDGVSFTSDQVVAVVGYPEGTHHNAIGALTRSCVLRWGAQIEEVGVRKSIRPQSHARRKMVYRLARP